MKLKFTKTILVGLKSSNSILYVKGQSKDGTTCSFAFGLDCITGPESCDTNCQ